MISCARIYIYMSLDNEKVDYELITQLLEYTCESAYESGAILVCAGDNYMSALLYSHHTTIVSSSPTFYVDKYLNDNPTESYLSYFVVYVVPIATAAV